MADPDKQTRVLVQVARGRSVVDDDGRVHKAGAQLELDAEDASDLAAAGFVVDPDEGDAEISVISPAQAGKTVQAVTSRADALKNAASAQDGEAGTGGGARSRVRRAASPAATS